MHTAATKPPKKAKPANGKPPQWDSFLSGKGHPSWVCPQCETVHEQSVCPAACKACGCAGDPGQAWLLKKKRGKARADGTGVLHWHCKTCGHDWTAHAGAKQCPKPKCQSKDLSAEIRGSVPPDETGTTTPAGIAANDPDAAAWKRDLQAEDLGLLKPANAAPSAQAQFAEIDLAAIFPSPANPRKTFPKAELDELATSIEALGQLDPLIVLPPVKGKYELVDGERRWRALKQLKRKTARVQVREMTAANAREFRLASFVRQGLNAIDAARAFQEAIERGGMTQDALAKLVGYSGQGAIANKLRLLKLPEKWQAKLITAEISERDARELIPFADVAAAMEGCLKGWKDFLQGREEGYGDSFESFVAEEVCSHSRNLTWQPKFKVTDAIKSELDVRKVNWEARAFNIKRFDELQDAAVKAAEKRAAGKQSKARDAEDDDAARPQETPADRKRKADQRRQQFAARVERWRLAWLQKLVAARLQDFDGPAAVIHKLILHFALIGRENLRRDEACKAVRSAGASMSNSYYSFAAWPALGKIEPAKLWGLTCEVLSKWVQHDLERACDVDERLIESLADELAIDVAKEWKLSREFLELYGKEELAKLRAEWGMPPAPASATRKGVIDLTLLNASVGKTPKCPKVLLGGKKGKR